MEAECKLSLRISVMTQSLYPTPAIEEPLDGTRAAFLRAPFFLLSNIGGVLGLCPASFQP